MAYDDDTIGDRAAQREKGPFTLMKAADELARERAKDERDAAEKRDARQDDRTDKAWTLALAAAESGQLAAGRTVKMLYALLAASILANVILTAMVLDAKLNVSSNGVSVGAEQ